MNIFDIFRKRKEIPAPWSKYYRDDELILNIPNISVYKQLLNTANKYPNNIVRPCGTIHDAIMLEVKKEYTDRVSKDLKEMMEHPSIFQRHHVQFNIPIEAEVEVGPWSKGVVWKEKE